MKNIREFIKNNIKQYLNEKFEDKNKETDFNIFMNNLVNNYDYDNIYISFRNSMDATKINIKNVYNTPTGIYTYRLKNFFYKPKDNWDLYDFYGNSLKFPFATGYPFLHFYVLKDNANILSKLTDKSVFDNYVLKIKEIFKNNNEIEKECDEWFKRKDSTNLSFCNYFWEFLYFNILGGKRSETDKPNGNTNIKFTNLCNKLGIDGFDDNNEGFIHINEKIQTVFFKPNLFDTIEVFNAKRDGNLVKPGLIKSIPIDINTIRKIINKYGFRKGVYYITQSVLIDGEKEIELYNNVLKDNELSKYFINDSVKAIITSSYPIKLINIIVKNGYKEHLTDFIKTMKSSDKLFKYILENPDLTGFLNKNEVIQYYITNKLNLDFFYNYLNPNNSILNYGSLSYLINNATDSEKMLRFLIPTIEKLKDNDKMYLYALLDDNILGKLMLNLIK